MCNFDVFSTGVSFLSLNFTVCGVVLIFFFIMFSSFANLFEDACRGWDLIVKYNYAELGFWVCFS